ncbi:SDR family NAD(P)-dependent oxidoreductase [Salinisphaera sp. USBA-960]|nr:SDR family NAD(P)-dependent oxidoreductase [Salifodinibacter halophilus]NNC25955.1 SDR family NAD(P)-dependent oxidoreductase [Salifodinibacter halophilus]
MDAVVSSPESAPRARALGATAHIHDLDMADLALERPDYLFYCAPPPRTGNTDTRLAGVIDCLDGSERPTNTVYISTAGVYGDRQGEWVDEDSALMPETGRAKRRVDAETQIRDFDSAARILRAPGIYGPGRLPVAAVRSGAPILTDAEAGWRNRIHIDDLAAVAWRASAADWPSGAVNVSDGHPTPLGAFYDELADMLGVAPVPRISWAEAQQRYSDTRLSFLRESRRLDNRRLLAALGHALFYPDYRDGLAACRPGEVD